MANSQNTQKANELATTMSKFKTVEAAKAWWNAKSAAQKGATIGIIVGMGMGGHAFFATYKAYGVASGLWAGVLYGSASGFMAGSLSQMAFTDKATLQGLGDDL